MFSALRWWNHQNRLSGYFSMPQPIVLWNKGRSHTWVLENKNPPMPLSSIIGPITRYFILIPTSNGEWNAEIYNSPSCWQQRCERYDFSYSPNWNSSMLWIVCEHQSSHPKPWTRTLSTTILSFVPLFIITICYPRNFTFIPIRTKYIWTKDIFFHPTSFCTIFHQFFFYSTIWCYWGSSSHIL